MNVQLRKAVNDYVLLCKAKGSNHTLAMTLREDLLKALDDLKNLPRAKRQGK